jgi:hypothetical protein
MARPTAGLPIQSSREFPKPRQKSHRWTLFWMGQSLSIFVSCGSALYPVQKRAKKLNRRKQRKQRFGRDLRAPVNTCPVRGTNIPEETEFNSLLSSDDAFNTLAVVIFLAVGKIYWAAALVVGAATIVGGYGGA